MKKIVMGILFLVFQLIGFSDNFLGNWEISDWYASHEVFTIFKMNNKYYKVVRYNNGNAIISELDKKNNKLYAIDDEEKYIYSYDKENNRLIENIENKDYYEEYSKMSNYADLNKCDTYIFSLNSKILKKTGENVTYQNFIGQYSDIHIYKNKDNRYCIKGYDIQDDEIRYDSIKEEEVLNAKHKELFNENIKVYFSEITQPFIDGLNIKNLKAGDKVLTVEYNDVLDRNGEYYYIPPYNEE